MERAPGIVVSGKVLCTLSDSTDTKSRLRQKSLCGDGSQKARYSGEAGCLRDLVLIFTFSGQVISGCKCENTPRVCGPRWA